MVLCIGADKSALAAEIDEQRPLRHSPTSIGKQHDSSLGAAPVATGALPAVRQGLQAGRGEGCKRLASGQKGVADPRGIGGASRTMFQRPFVVASSLARFSQESTLGSEPLGWVERGRKAVLGASKSSKSSFGRPTETIANDGNGPEDAVADEGCAVYCIIGH
ncbi:hypothetical protein cyc_01444 [Cyclospora cayetanensis]|uniref:Uncharacterized protein n=1 Tax=Cyclospora cayetanensis TaxID=88456 RepID=A0A1D3D5V3_9EIME|nr:hypothetical protein cyc_01444 [Cyclospora cayetanensis]